jgi:hypothetical protein
LCQYLAVSSDALDLPVSFLLVLVCLVFSVLSTIEEHEGFAQETLFWMVGRRTGGFLTRSWCSWLCEKRIWSGLKVV